jgi:hypothetical protein
LSTLRLSGTAGHASNSRSLVACMPDQVVYTSTFTVNYPSRSRSGMYQACSAITVRDILGILPASGDVYNVYNLISAYVHEILRTCLGSLDGAENDLLVSKPTAGPS